MSRMARTRRGAAARRSASREQGPVRAPGSGGRGALTSAHEWFGRFAQETSRLSGKPAAFLLAAALVAIWLVTGPMFGYSDTWQLVINTGTTVVTFLMVFLIQNTQNRDTLALQLKLGELILVIREAEDRFATIEDLTDDELDALHQESRARAERAQHALERRRSQQATSQKNSDRKATKANGPNRPAKS